MILRFTSYPDHLAQFVAVAHAAADPFRAVQAHLRWQGESLEVGDRVYRPERIFLVAVGKAAGAMAAAANEILADRLTQGILIQKRGHPQPILSPTIRCFVADHPVPTPDNLVATQAVLTMLAQTQPGDLVLCLISGGTSALLTQPHLPLTDWQALTQALLASGCPIDAFNRVRQFFDAVKGGGLALAAAPAACSALILSDVVGNPLDIIGSGPTVGVEKDAAATRHILDQYNVWSRLSPTTHERLAAQLNFTPADPSLNSTNSPEFVYNQLVADGAQMASAVATAAQQRGWQTQILTTHLQGEAGEVGRFAAALAQDASPNTAYILAGETTVTLGSAPGLGGRNQELALAAAIHLAGIENVIVASFASDGEDGVTTAAGAVATGQTVPLARQAGLLPELFLAWHDSFTFWQKLGDAAAFSVAGGHIHTGPTGTNVNDLLLIFKYS